MPDRKDPRDYAKLLAEYCFACSGGHPRQRSGEDYYHPKGSVNRHGETLMCGMLCTKRVMDE